MKFNPDVCNQIIREVTNNGTAFPDVTNVIYSLKTETDHAERDADGKLVIDQATQKPKRVVEQLAHPILTTTVYFGDATKVTVKNSESDPIEIEEVTVDDASGKKVKVASKASKERALLYAIFKRLCMSFNDYAKSDLPEVKDAPTGRILSEIVDGSVDQALEEAMTKLRKAQAKKAAEEAKNQPKKAKLKHYSMGETLARVNVILDAIVGKNNDVPADKIAERIAKIFRD